MSKIYNLNITCTSPLPSPYELIRELPASLQQRTFIEEARQQVKNILDRKDPRFLLIVGPCSIHDLESAKEYAAKLKELSQQVSDTFFVVMRAYVEKPRTSMGWKGLAYDPKLDGSNDIGTGLRLSRKLFLDLADLEIPIATELLDPLMVPYLGDLVAWGCIGARTSSSQTHRQMASGLSLPVAFKNNTDGNVDVAVHGVIAAAAPHTFLGMNEKGQAAITYTKGNPYGHVVLRGGKSGPNYSSHSITSTLDKLQDANQPLRIIIDCSHDNSGRDPDQQTSIFQSVINQYVEGNQYIRGLILESHLNGGKQAMLHVPEILEYGVSITDACLDWKTTERLITWGCAKIRQQNETHFKAKPEALYALDLVH